MFGDPLSMIGGIPGLNNSSRASGMTGDQVYSIYSPFNVGSGSQSNGNMPSAIPATGGISMLPNIRPPSFTGGGLDMTSLLILGGAVLAAVLIMRK